VSKRGPGLGVWVIMNGLLLQRLSEVVVGAVTDLPVTTAFEEAQDK
jgi:hypothetical protein